MPRPPKQTNSKLAIAIRKRRRDKEKSQAEVAKACTVPGRTVSAATVSNWESGEQEPNATSLRLLANFLECDLVALLNGEIKPISEGSLDRAASPDETAPTTTAQLLNTEIRDVEVQTLKRVNQTLQDEIDSLKKEKYLEEQDEEEAWHELLDAFKIYEHIHKGGTRETLPYELRKR